MSKLALLTLLFTALVARSAHAESKEQEAARHRKAATTAFELSDYARAIDEYKKAYELAPDPRLLYNLGLCHLKRHQLEGAPDDLTLARDSFNRFLALARVD